MGIVLVVVGAAVSTYGFGLLHSLEFGPLDYICPAYSCAPTYVFQAGYGQILELSYVGIISFVVGIALFVALLLARNWET